MMVTKVAIIIVMAFILFSLGSGLFHLVFGESEDKKMLKALTWRISLSVGLFILLIAAFATGFIKPHGI